MDPLTQGLLGASFGQALYGRALGRRALGWGAAIAMLPDLDMVSSVRGPMAEWLWHRGPTHALCFAFVFGPAIGWALWRRHGGGRADDPSRPGPPPGRRRDWIGLAVVALFTHPLLDLFTSYGTQLLLPFSRARFALDTVAIVDPAYSVILAVALVLGWRSGPATTLARASAFMALAVSSAYLAAGLAVKADTEAAARAELAAAGVRVSRITAYPTLLQLPLRRIVARSGDRVYVGWRSALRQRPIAWRSFTSATGPLVDAARATREARILEWFALGETAARVESTGNGALVELDDLRYGLPGHPREGFWGVRVRLDAAGRPAGPPSCFRRPLAATFREMLARLRGMLTGETH
jgi:inner membrane protein